jgi:hypothetical protein
VTLEAIPELARTEFCAKNQPFRIASAGSAGVLKRGVLLMFTRLVKTVLAAAALFGAISVMNCSDEAPDCSGQPSYRVTVSALMGPLPADLKLRVEYGAGCESYSLSERKSLPCVDGGEVGILFCSPEFAPVADAAADAAAPDGSVTDASVSDAGNAPSGAVISITCTVWNAGGMVTVQTAEYPETPLELGREDNGCGPADFNIVLTRTDATP